MGIPVGLFLFQLEGLPCFRTGGSGQWMQSLAGVSVLRDGFLVPFRDSSLPLFRSPVSFTMFRVCLPRAPALRQVLEAMLAEGAFESPSVLVLDFQSSLPSRLMGWRSVIVSSHLDGCVSLAPFMMVTIVSVLSQSESRLFLLPWT